MYLWYTFAKKHKLHIINSYLSGFKYHDNQITFRETGSTDLYLEEAKNFVDPIKIKDFFYYIRFTPMVFGQKHYKYFSVVKFSVY